MLNQRRVTNIGCLVALFLLMDGCQMRNADPSGGKRFAKPNTSHVSGKDRPPRDFRGPYNTRRSDLDGFEGEIWTESDDLKEFTDDEYFAVRNDLVAALSKHGIVYDPWDKEDHDFYVYDDMYFDRTQKIELNATERLAELLPDAVLAAQGVLTIHPLWRVMFIADDGDDEFFVVYPDAIRIAQCDAAPTLASSVNANAKLRLARFQKREEHRRRRAAELQHAIKTAIERSASSDEEFMLIAWYDTISAVTWEWGWEGRGGSSIWLLPKTPVDDVAKNVKSPLECSARWVLPDGQLLEAEHELDQERATQVLHFEDESEVVPALKFKVHGKSFRFAKPDEEVTQ